ncbi:hypothetical protein BOO71_0004525 [Deinococcus marmoris]|uniref:Uncharacterized protein n=1 Tax=Deinococcus marmoris TaxID=249408 RepID=A0A1U7P116_9DEIO|nr:hypothetical protein BOO71_0004525 [Deinococcus marmoris]
MGDADDPGIVLDPAAARLLLNPQARMVLGPFFGRDVSVGEAAAELGLKPNTLLRQVQGLVTRGLLRVSVQQRRAGRPIKRYRVTHERFFVPFWATDAITLEELLMAAVEEPNRLISRSVARLSSAETSRLGYLITRRDSGRIAHDLSLDGQRCLTLEDLERPWLREGRTLYLTPERARLFVQELSGLLDRYGEKDGEAHLAFVAVAPLGVGR